MLRKFVWAVVVLLGTSSAFAADGGYCCDHPLFRRPFGYEIVEHTVGDRVVELPSGRGTLSRAGRLTEIFYRTRIQPLSSSALGQRFLLSLQKAGGEIVFRENPGLGGRRIVGKLARKGKNVWVMQEVTALREYRLIILETPKGEAPMSYRATAANTSVKAMNNEMEAQVLDLLHLVDRTRKLEFPARFAHGSSTLPKGYEANFKKCVMLMDKDPSLKFRVASYTESDLRSSEQRTLLRDRTSRLFEALVEMGADRERLTTEVPAEGAADVVPRGVVRLTVVDSIPPAQ
jgi:outer membrane protein OmpA-like peptidoglycan-associated protein